MTDEPSHLQPCCAKAVYELLQIFRRQLAEERAEWRRERAEYRELARRDREAFADLAAKILSEFSKRILERDIHELLREREQEERKIGKWEGRTGKRLGGGFDPRPKRDWK